MTEKDLVFDARDSVNATILSGQTVSDVVDLGGARLVGVITPSSLTGTAMTFQASTASDGTFTPVYKTDGTTTAQFSITVSTSRWTVIPPEWFAGIRFLKVVSGTAEGGNRTITLVLKTSS